jgi:putative hydrolase of the HAD superfamily
VHRRRELLSGDVVVNIIFDLAGVVVQYDQAALLAAVFPDPALHATVRTDIIGHGDWLALDRGTLSEPDAIVQAAQRTGLSATAITQFLAQMAAAWVPIAGTVDLLYRLHVKGHPLFCLSNMHVASLAYLEQTYGFWDVFTGVVISCRVQLIKPEPAIYAYILAQYGLEASHTVFIDDTVVNLEAAAQSGIQTIQFENPEQCARQLQALGCL